MSKQNLTMTALSQEPSIEELLASLKKEMVRIFSVHYSKSKLLHTSLQFSWCGENGLAMSVTVIRYARNFITCVMFGFSRTLEKFTKCISRVHC